MRLCRSQARACGLTLLWIAATAGPAPPQTAPTAETSTQAAAEAAVEQPASRAAAQQVRDRGEPGEPGEPETRYEDEITVTGRDEPSLTVPSREAAARELALVPGGAGLVDAEEYRRGRASTLKDVLELSPGVFVQPRFGAEEARLSIRGSGLQRTFHGRGIRLLQDGVPLNLADGGFDFQAVEPLAARYVEVLRGANALQYGSSTLGGAINFVTLTGHDAGPMAVRVEGGSFANLRGQAAGALSRGAVDSFATLTHSSQDGYRAHAAQDNQRLFANLGWRPREDREARAYLTALRSRSQLPGNLTLAELGADPRLAAPRNVELDQRRDFDLLRLASRTSLLLGPASHLDAAGFWSYKHLDHPIFQVLDQLSHDVGGEIRYENGADLAGRANSFVVGVSPVLGVLADDRFVNVLGRRGARAARGETRSVNFDLYAEDRHELRPGLRLVAGVQLSHAGRDFDDAFLADGDQTDRQSFRGVSPKLGLLLDLPAGTAVFANVSRSFEPPSFGELVNLGGGGLLKLDAQTATSAEVGSRGQARGRAGRASWDVVLYHARLDGELLGLSDAAGNPLGTINAGRTLHSGAEVGFDLRGEHLQLRQVYDWSRFRFSRDSAFDDNQIAGIPEHFFRTELLYHGGSGLYGGPSLEWVPDRYPVDHANTLFAEGYTALGVKLGYRPERGIAGFVEVKNLTDEVYSATTGVIADARGRDAAQFLPADGASVFAGLEYRW